MATDGSAHTTERAACMHQYKLQLKALFEAAKPGVKCEDDAVNAIIKNPKQFRAAISRYINLIARGALVEKRRAAAKPIAAQVLGKNV